MPRRFVTALLAIALLITLVLLYVSTRNDPPENSVEWHKQQYLTLFNARAGKTLSARCARFWRKVTGAALNRRLDVSNSVALSSKLDLHREALITMKYLTERTVRLTNAPAQVVLIRAYRSAANVIPKSRMQFTNFSWYDPNGIVIIVTGYAEDMPILEKLVCDADMP